MSAAENPMPIKTRSRDKTRVLILAALWSEVAIIVGMNFATSLGSTGAAASPCETPAIHLNVGRPMEQRP